MEVVRCRVGNRGGIRPLGAREEGLPQEGGAIVHLHGGTRLGRSGEQERGIVCDTAVRHRTLNGPHVIRGGRHGDDGGDGVSREGQTGCRGRDVACGIGGRGTEGVGGPIRDGGVVAPGRPGDRCVAQQGGIIVHQHGGSCIGGSGKYHGGVIGGRSLCQCADYRAHIILCGREDDGWRGCITRHTEMGRRIADVAGGIGGGGVESVGGAIGDGGRIAPGGGGVGGGRAQQGGTVINGHDGIGLVGTGENQGRIIGGIIRRQRTDDQADIVYYGGPVNRRRGGVYEDAGSVGHTVQCGVERIACPIQERRTAGCEGGTNRDAIVVGLAIQHRVEKGVGRRCIPMGAGIKGVHGVISDGQRQVGRATRCIDRNRFRKRNGKVQGGIGFVYGILRYADRRDGRCRGVHQYAGRTAHTVERGGQLVTCTILKGATAWGDGRPGTDAIGVGFVGLNRITEEMGGGRCAVDAVVEGVNRRPVQIQ